MPTRTPHLVNNPFASLTKDEAEARLADLYPQRAQLEYEIAQLQRIVLSYNVMYYDKDGKVCRAV